MRHQLREALGIVADLLGVIGFVILVWGLVGKQLQPLLAQLSASNLLLVLLGALLIAIDIAVRLSGRSAASPYARPPTGPPPAARPRIPTPAPAPEPAPAPAPKPRIFVNRTPEELIANFKGATVVQGEARIAPYVGNWMRVSGAVRTVAQISPNLATAYFADRSIFSYNDVYMKFQDKKWVDRVVLMSPGDKLAVVGQIESVDPQTVHLSSCEIEE